MAIGISLRMLMVAGQSGPAAATSLTATADGGYTRINLAWTDNAGGTAVYRVYRSTDDVSYSLIDTTAAGQEWYTDTGLTRGQIYYYYVAAYEGGVEGDASNTDNATVFALSDVTLYAEYDADAGVYNDAGSTLATDGQTVQEIHDQTGNGRHITQTTEAAKPTLQTNELNSLPVIRHADGDILQAATAADWKFMHDGTEFAVYVVSKVTATNPDAVSTMLDTGARSSSTIGFILHYDDRSASSRQDNVVVTVAKGVGGDFEIEAISETEAARSGEWHIVSARLNSTQMEVRTDGHWGGPVDATPDGAPSASNPTAALTVGGRYGGTECLDGDWARVLIVSGTVSDADHQAIQDYLAETYDLFETRWFGAASVVSHATIEPDHLAFPGIAIADNGDLVIAYVRQQDHNDFHTNASLAVRISSDGGDNWGSSIVVHDNTGTDAWINPKLTTLSDGRTLMAVEKRESGSVVVDGIGYFESSDNGATWSSVTQLTAPTYNDWVAGSGNILELANGDLLFPYAGRDTTYTGSRKDIAVLRSQDGGDTWSTLAKVLDGETDAKNYTEAGLALTGNGDEIVCLARDITNGSGAADDQYLVAAYSSDSGATWSGNTAVVLANGKQSPLKLASGELISISRGGDIAVPQPAVVVFSADQGDTWQVGWQFETSPNFTNKWMNYGQAAQGANGTIYVVYAMENTPEPATEADIMFAKTE